MKVYRVNCLLGIVVGGNSSNLLSNSYIAKNINMSISLTVRDRAISSKGYLINVLLAISKNFTLPKNGGHFEFSNFCQKWKNTNLLLSH